MLNENDLSDLISFVVWVAVIIAVLIITAVWAVCFLGPKTVKILQTVLIEPAVKNWNSVSDLPAKNNIEFCDNVFGFHKNSQR